MRRLLSLAVWGWLVLGLPAQAQVLVPEGMLGTFARPSRGPINLNRPEVPPPGRFSLVSQGLFTPYQLVVIDGKPYSPNPREKAYNRFALSTQLEAGLLPDMGLSFTLPFGLSRQIDGTMLGSGLADLNLGLFWHLDHDARTSWKTRVHANFGAGNLAGRIAEGVPSVGLDNSLRVELLPDFLYGHVNLNYLYHLRSTGLALSSDLPVVQWRGQRLQFNTALEAAWTPALSGILEILAQVDSPSEAQRQIVKESGAAWIALAPGLSYAFTPAAVGHLSVVLPVFRGGYQDSFHLSAVTGMVLTF